MLDELAAALRRHPDRPAVLTAGRTGAPRTRASRGELADLADGYAAALHHHGLAAGDTLGVAVRPGPRALSVLLAAHRLGLRVAVLDPSAGPDVLTARLALARPALVVADAAAQAAAGWARPLAGRARLALPRLAELGPVRTVGGRLPGCAPALRPRPGPAPDRGGPDDDAVIIFTSGTTSRPRAVVHRRAGLAAGECAPSPTWSGHTPTLRCSAARSSSSSRPWPAAPRWPCQPGHPGCWRGRWPGCARRPATSPRRSFGRCWRSDPGCAAGSTAAPRRSAPPCSTGPDGPAPSRRGGCTRSPNSSRPPPSRPPRRRPSPAPVTSSARRCRA
ncbi:hypothetical protein MCAG_00508 [Micromonospora sp. ATCC 39149]|nr:hypothetical protein MCAG_00508 [Micromonospora sp. ATCC 39149]